MNPKQTTKLRKKREQQKFEAWSRDFEKKRDEQFVRKMELSKDDYFSELEKDIKFFNHHLRLKK